MTSSSWLALAFTVSCFAPSTEVPSLPNETYVYPAAVFNATQQICSQENLRQGIINGIKQDSYHYIQNILRAHVYTNCKDALTEGQTTSGVYTIQPDSQPSFQAYCDMTTDGGGWTVFQRRIDGSVDFYRYWTDYQQGFGSPSGEFWLGLDKIHRLTSVATQLRIDLRDFNELSAYAKYTTFSVGDSASKYTLTVSGYSGTAGDSLTYHNGHRFSTRDQDNDAGSGFHCAQVYQGAWWYNYCYWSNLNGLYYNARFVQCNGVTWWHWMNACYTLKFTEMKLK